MTQQRTQQQRLALKQRLRSGPPMTTTDVAAAFCVGRDAARRLMTATAHHYARFVVVDVVAGGEHRIRWRPAASRADDVEGAEGACPMCGRAQL